MKKNIQLNEQIACLLWHNLSIKDINFLIMLSNIPSKIIAVILFGLSYTLIELPFYIKIFISSVIMIAPYIYASIFCLSKKQDFRTVMKLFFNLRTNQMRLSDKDDILEFKEYLNILLTTTSAKTNDIIFVTGELKSFANTYHKDILKFSQNKFELLNSMKGDLAVIFENILGGRLPHLDHSDLIYSMLKDLNKNKDDFFQNYLRTEKSFKHLFFDLSLRGNMLDLDILLFALLIPRNKDLNLDYYKQILKGCRFNSKESHINITNSDIFLSSPIKQLLKFVDSKHGIDFSFANYSDSDLCRLFSSKYNEQDFIKLYKTIVEKDNKTPLPVLKDFSELINYIDFFDLTYPVPSFKEKIEKLSINGLKFKTVLSYGHLGTLAHCLENCLKSRHSKLSKNMSQIVEIIKNEQTVGALEIVNKKVVEIKGYRNAPISNTGEIKKIIENLIN